MFYKGDFHIHTTKSDGEYTPTEIVHIAKERGFDIIAITDHNTLAGIEEAKKVGDEIGVKVIPGLELSTRYKGKKVHILGYFDDNNYKDNLIHDVLRSVKKHDINNLKILLKDKVKIVEDTKKFRITPETGIDILRYFGAITVLAHPVKLNKNYLEDIINMKFDGIEAKYFKNTDYETFKFINKATGSGRFYTAGSDFHTDKRKDTRHGIIGDVYLEKNEIINFLNALNNKI